MFTRSRLLPLSKQILNNNRSYNKVINDRHLAKVYIDNNKLNNDYSKCINELDTKTQFKLVKSNISLLKLINDPSDKLQRYCIKFNPKSIMYLNKLDRENIEFAKIVSSKIQLNIDNLHDNLLNNPNDNRLSQEDIDKISDNPLNITNINNPSKEMLIYLKKEHSNIYNRIKKFENKHDIKFIDKFTFGITVFTFGITLFTFMNYVICDLIFFIASTVSMFMIGPPK